MSENGSRRENRHLFAIHHCFERGPNCDFRFAEADIAADQAVHRLGALHVDFCIDDRLHLIRRFAKRKRILKFRLPSCVRAKRVTGMRLPFRLKCEHFARVIENGSSCVFLGARPFRVSERTEWRRLFADTDVTRNQIGLFERDVEFCFVGKLEREDFLSSIFCSNSRVGCAL